MTEATLYSEIVEIIQREAELDKYVALSPETLQELLTDFPPLATPAVPQVARTIPQQPQAPISTPAPSYAQRQAPTIQHTQPNRSVQQTPAAGQQPAATPQQPAATPQQPKTAGQTATPTIAAASIDLSGLTEEWLSANSSAATRIYNGTYLKIHGEGSVESDLMFIGEAQGRGANSANGEPSELLTKMITAMKFSKQTVYIADMLYTVPESPEAIESELSVCVSYLQKIISIVKPKAIVFLGPLPLRLLLNKRGVSRHHGEWDTYMDIKVMPTYHPALLLRDQSLKKDAWEDLKKVMNVLGSEPDPKYA